MDSKGTIMICDAANSNLEEIRTGLQNEGWSVEVINDASELIPRAIRARPGVLIVNPDMQAFNAYDVCKHLMQDLSIPVILLVEKTSTTRDLIDQCRADDVVTKPVKIDNLVFLVSKNYTIAH